MKFDVIVVGAGPAGTAAAISLARAGAHVVVLERHNFPRDKSCGDGLTPRAIELLEGLGFATSGMAVHEMVLRSTSDRTQELRYPFQRPGATIRRIDLDHQLALLAVGAGAEVRLQTTVESLLVEDGVVRGVRTRTGIRAAETIRAPLTLVAEGSTGSIAGQVQEHAVPGRTMGFAIRRYVEGVEWEGPPSFEIEAPITANDIPMAGYGWIFPMSGQTANIGVGCYVKPDRPTNLSLLLEGFEADLFQKDPRFRIARRCSRPTGAPILTGTGESHGQGALLIGDCAGIANPFSSEGISQALQSGAMAASTGLKFLEGHGRLSEYSAELAAMRLSYNRLTPGLPIVYTSLRNVARDFLPMVHLNTAIGRTFRGALLRDICSRPPTRFTEHASAIEQAEAASQARAAVLITRDRDFFRGFLEEVQDLPDMPRSGAGVFFRAVRATFPEVDLRSPELRRAGTCFELIRLAAYLLDDLDVEVEGPAPDGSRGGSWLAATIGLAVADRVLGRSFWLSGRLPTEFQCIVSDGIVDIFDHLTSDVVSGRAQSATRLDQVLETSISRSGERVGALLLGNRGQLAAVVQQ